MAHAIETLAQISADPELVRKAEERDLSRYFYEMSLATAKREGLLEGQLKGKVDTLLLLLHTKFGAVPEEIQKRVLHATDPELSLWAQRLLSATSVEDVFED